MRVAEAFAVIIAIGAWKLMSGTQSFVLSGISNGSMY